MAVFYKWIKGCTTSATLTSGNWSYLAWGDGATTTTAAMPKLYASSGRASNPTDLTSYGYILTSAMPQPLIKSNWVTRNALYFVSQNFINDYENQLPDGLVSADPQNGKYIKLYYNTDDVFHILGGRSSKVQLQTSNFKILSTLYGTPFSVVEADNVEYTDLLGEKNRHGRFLVNDLLKVNTEAEIARLKVNNISVFNSEVTINAGCTAHWFNATSDRRAKENIQLATYKALDLINKLQVYTYNYKNTPEKLTGIIAQDLLEQQPDELDLVSNIHATGKDGDYMSIKNDKLIFVLMKAIQEQQEQISSLQVEIEKLKKIN